MGVVYRAVRDNDYRQEVAIKVVSRAEHFLIARFRRSAGVAANHPNIARLLDGGATPVDGPPGDGVGGGDPSREYCSQNGLGCASGWTVLNAAVPWNAHELVAP